MTASYLPQIFVPLVGLLFPAVIMISIFLYIEISRSEIN
nr:photosystem I subunit VIII [Poropsis sp. ID1_4]